MLEWLRRLLDVTPTDYERLERRVEALERAWPELQLDVTSLTDKLATQLKRIRARAVDPEPTQSREEMLNEAIRARRRSRFMPELPHANGDS